MRIFLSGGTGFVGNHVINALLENGHMITALVRPGSENKLHRHDEVNIFPGDPCEPGDLNSGSLGCDAIINLVGVIRDYPRRGFTFERLHTGITRDIISAAKQNHISRILHMSALGAGHHASTAYFRTKFAAEELLRQSGLEYTIFRPSLIFGRNGDAIRLFAGMTRKFLVPIIGNGRYCFNPISVRTVAQGFEKALSLRGSIGRILELGGPDEVTFDEIMDIIARVSGRRIFKLHIPVFPLRLSTSVMQYIPGYPLSSDQITMLLQGSTCDPAPFYQLTGITPVSLEETIKEAICP
ncbi:MAG: complex I NDUFA9 subunit family protein [Deltaproteobacteria bacterium]|nr:complex I NDUFA9 subunit family protein [Deltaproteobacteria bacterium]